MDKRLLDVLVCPVTKGSLTLKNSELWSSAAGLAYPIQDGIPKLIESEARQLESDEISQLKDEKKKL
jgi:uncharacterized protein YbaR (Trm112 family)